MRKMIVKVQVFMPARDRMMIYNQGREYLYEGKITPAVKALMETNPQHPGEQGWKRYFHAVMDMTAHGGVRFNLGEPAEWQTW